jgi:hypothetical protein
MPDLDPHQINRYPHVSARISKDTAARIDALKEGIGKSKLVAIVLDTVFRNSADESVGELLARLEAARPASEREPVDA